MGYFHRTPLTRVKIREHLEPKETTKGAYLKPNKALERRNEGKHALSHCHEAQKRPETHNDLSPGQGPGLQQFSATLDIIPNYQWGWFMP